MQRRRSLLGHFVLAGRWITGLLFFASFAWAFQPSVGEQARGKIKHVIIIVQENRTFDDIFGGGPAVRPPEFGPCPQQPFGFPGADSLIPSAIAPKMQCGQFRDPSSINASHDVWQCLENFTSNGSPAPFTTDAWLNVVSSQPICPSRPTQGSFNTSPFSYLGNNLRKPYWDLAKAYVLGDHFFAVTSTSSFPGHQYIVAARSVARSTNSASEVIVADQPASTTGNSCFDFPNARVKVPYLNNDNYISDMVMRREGECYDANTLAALMDAHKPEPVTWKHFVTAKPVGDGKFEGIPTFDGFINILNYYQATTTWPTSVEGLKKQIDTAALPSVSWVKPPCTQLSDHPGGVSSNDSSSWVASVVSWVGKSNLWNDTAIFVLWDDWGGFYDHVAPPNTRIDRLGPGLRTPFLVISPYGVNGTVVHTQADYGSVLKFVEDLFGLPRLTNVDRDANDLVGFFDFSKKHPFVPVPDTFAKSMCEGPTADPRLIDP